MAKKYKITNYGNTRTVYVKRQSWEITKHQTIEVDDWEVAQAFKKLPFVDVETIEQPDVKPSKEPPKKKKKKAPKKVSKQKKKATPKIRKKVKRRKVKRRKK